MCRKLALELSHDADLLIIDEPASGIYSLVRSHILEIMTDYMKTGGKSVFFSIHIMSDLDILVLI